MDICNNKRPKSCFVYISHHIIANVCWVCKYVRACVRLYVFSVLDAQFYGKIHNYFAHNQSGKNEWICMCITPKKKHPPIHTTLSLTRARGVCLTFLSRTYVYIIMIVCRNARYTNIGYIIWPKHTSEAQPMIKNALQLIIIVVIRSMCKCVSVYVCWLGHSVRLHDVIFDAVCECVRERMFMAEKRRSRTCT